MSYLNSQLNAFKSNLSSSSQKISNKRTVADPIRSTPSPAPSQTSTTSKHEAKRKRPETSTVVYSQPANTGTGKNIMTQMTYAVEYLKQKETPQTLPDLLSYLSLQYHGEDYKKSITKLLRSHEKIEFDPNGFNGQGSFRFRPKHNIRTGDQLIGYLQAQRTAQGLSAKELKDGWPNAEDVIRDLEQQGKLLVTRNKKDDIAKMVWPNDPTLITEIDDEFKGLWKQERLQSPTDIIVFLEKHSLQSTDRSRGAIKKPKVQVKKTKKPRKSGKMTNVHMVGVLRDFSHLKK